MFGSIVVKGKLPTFALPSVTALKSVDLPTDGLPTTPITMSRDDEEVEDDADEPFAGPADAAAMFQLWLSCSSS